MHRNESNQIAPAQTFIANYQVWYVKDVLIAILCRQIHVDHTNLCIHRDPSNGRTALHHNIDSNLMREKKNSLKRHGRVISNRLTRQERKQLTAFECSCIESQPNSIAKMTDTQ